MSPFSQRPMPRNTAKKRFRSLLSSETSTPLLAAYCFVCHTMAFRSSSVMNFLKTARGPIFFAPERVGPVLQPLNLMLSRLSSVSSHSGSDTSDSESGFRGQVTAEGTAPVTTLIFHWN
eukprot:TRINITY_DN1573_c0_g1_i2.p1 TRINITY_DN1573_c0_g1~~TRINITY_DN1573_c0_g1_i2.p1  ORF type:complete len:119 (-),score=5.25 TRINITY_DN1573_c0_g1_i2:336-692(-)